MSRIFDKDLEPVQLDMWKDTRLKQEHIELAESEALRQAIGFDEMPGPMLLRHISQAWKYLPVMGSQVTTGTLQYLLNAGKILGKRSYETNTLM